MRAMLVVLAVLAGCDAYAPDLGESPYLCAATAPRCPHAYTCVARGGAEVCVSGEDPPVDAAGVPAGCNDDTAYGMNDAISGAYATNLSAGSPQLALPNLAICPDADRDHFVVSITTRNQGLEVTSRWSSGSPVQVAILNASGVSVVNGVSIGATANRACVPNLSIGSWYAVAFAAESNNYDLEIRVVAACQ